MKISIEGTSIYLNGECKKTIIFVKKEKGFSGTSYVKVAPPARHTFAANRGNTIRTGTGIYTDGDTSITACFGYEKKRRKK